MKGCDQGGLSAMDWTPDEDTLDLIRHVAIQNAIEYEGKGAIGSVIGRIMGMRADLRQHGKIVTGLVAQEVNKANASAATDGLESLREILTSEAPHLLEKREVKERRTGLPELKDAEKGNREVNHERTDDVLETGAKVVATGCPFCNTMMTDGVKNAEREGDIEVKDIAELIAEAADLL